MCSSVFASQVLYTRDVHPDHQPDMHGMTGRAVCRHICSIHGVWRYRMYLFLNITIVFFGLEGIESIAT